MRKALRSMSIDVRASVLDRITLGPTQTTIMYFYFPEYIYRDIRLRQDLPPRQGLF